MAAFQSNRPLFRRNAADGDGRASLVVSDLEEFRCENQRLGLRSLQSFCRHEEGVAKRLRIDSAEVRRLPRLVWTGVLGRILLFEGDSTWPPKRRRTLLADCRLLPLRISGSPSSR